jgi:hypothetical protein
MIQKKIYAGWMIELIPSSGGYIFQCWIPGEQIGISNRRIYPTPLKALVAAKKRAKLESTSLALIKFLNQSFKTRNLDPDEHIALTSSIFDFVAWSDKPEI